jgi:hypothetical protein
MQANTVWQRRIRSDYWRSERYPRPGRSHCVGGYLKPLSLGLSDSVREFGPQMFVSFDRVPKDRGGALLARSDRTNRDHPAAWARVPGFDKGTRAGTLTGQCGQARNLPGGGEPTGPRPLSNPSQAAARAAGTGCSQNSRTRDLSDSGCGRCSRTSAVAYGEQNQFVTGASQLIAISMTELSNKMRYRISTLKAPRCVPDRA